MTAPGASPSGGLSPSGDGGLRGSSVRGVLWSAAEKGGDHVAKALVFAILARLLEPAAFGLVALASVVTAFLEVIIRQGFSTAIVQRPKLERLHVDSAVVFGTVAGGVLMAGVWLLADPIAAGLGEGRVAGVLRWLSLSFLLSGLNATMAAMLQRQLRFRALAVRSLLATTIGGGVGVGMAFAGLGVWALVGQTLTQYTVTAGVLLAANRYVPRPRFSYAHWRYLFDFGVKVAGNNILDIVNRRLDDLLIGTFLGPTALGYYTVAYRLLVILTRLFTQTLSDVALPTFSRMQGDAPRMRRALYEATRLSSAAAFPAFLGMAAIAPALLPLVFGPQWAPSVPLMQVLALIGVLHSVTYFNQSIMLAADRPGWALGVNVLNAVGNAIGFVIAVQFGVMAVAISYVARGYILSPVAWMLVKRLIGIDYGRYFRQFAGPLLASVVMVGAVVAVRGAIADEATLLVRVVVGVLTGIAVYLPALALFDRRAVRQFVTNVRVLLPGEA